jgi:hypothetical protein
MNNKKRGKIETSPYWYNKDITVYYELEHKDGLITPGETLRFKKDRKKYKFISFAHNSSLNVGWIDVMDVATGEFRAFYIEQLNGIFRAKRSRRKKND